MPKKKCDVLIIGGGLVGLSLAKGLEGLNLSYLLVDPSLANKIKPMPLTPRALALSKTSIAILKYLGLDFSQLNCTPIHQIQVSCEHAWGKLNLQEPAHDFLGQVINLVELQQKLLDSIAEKSALLSGRLHHYCPQTKKLKLALGDDIFDLEAKIIIAADGADSVMRQVCQLPLEAGPEQAAILGLLDLGKPHQGLAFERFTCRGPLALLPFGLESYALIWGMQSDQADELLRLGPQQVLDEVKKQFGTYLFDVLACSAIQTYPLKQVFMPKQQFQSILFLGNAAHTLHPVAGQGFNLSLRDVAVLIDCLEIYGVSQDLFPIYLLRREADQRLTQNMTKFLAAGMQKMTSRCAPLGGLGLSFLEHVPGMKDLFGFYAQGLGYPLPSWVYDYMDACYD